MAEKPEGKGWGGIGKAFCRLVDNTFSFGVAGGVAGGVVGSVLGAGVSFVTGSSLWSSMKNGASGGSKIGAAVGATTGCLVTAAEILKKPDWGPSPVGSPLGGIAEGTRYWFHWHDLDRPAPVKLPSKGYLPPVWVSSKNSMKEILAQNQARKEAAAAAAALVEQEAAAAAVLAEQEAAAEAEVATAEAEVATAEAEETLAAATAEAGAGNPGFRNPFQQSNEELAAIEAQMAKLSERRAEFKNQMAKKSSSGPVIA